MTLIPSSPYDEEVAFNLEDEEEIDTIVDHRRRIQVVVSSPTSSPAAKEINKNGAAATAGKSLRDRQKLEGVFFLIFIYFIYLFF